MPLNLKSTRKVTGLCSAKLCHVMPTEIAIDTDVQESVEQDYSIKLILHNDENAIQNSAELLALMVEIRNGGSLAHKRG